MPPSEFESKGRASLAFTGSARPRIFIPELDLRWGIFNHRHCTRRIYCLVAHRGKKQVALTNLRYL